MQPPKMMIASGALLAAWLTAASAAPAQTIWYVNDDGNASNGCTSWPDACPELQTALSLAGDGDQIWVATGTYRPDYDVKTAQHTGNREATFQLTSGVEMYGGFDGTETKLEKRAGLFDTTILTGDLLGNDGPDFENNDENSYHVVTAVGVEETTRLDGFKIKSGNANGPSQHFQGGGLRIDGASPKIANCFFTQNEATEGGGIYSMRGSSELRQCSFWGNGAVEGGAIMVEQGAMMIDDCVFSGNSAGFGGAVKNLDGDLALQSCTFESNSGTWGGAFDNVRSGLTTMRDCSFTSNTGYKGGGLRNWGSNLDATDCTFAGNSASYSGGGIHNTAGDPGAKMSLRNCTFTENDAPRGGGVYASPALEGSDEFINCLFTNNTATQYGGGLYKLGETSTLIANCRFLGNSVGDKGGGMANNSHSRPTLINCEFSGNSAVNGGGALWNYFNGSGFIINCTISNNTSSQKGGGVYNELESHPTFFNTVFWGNQDDGGQDESAQVFQDDGWSLFHYSIVEGWTGSFPGSANTGENPMFVDADGVDDKSGTEDDDLRLACGSPAIDAGINIAVPSDIGDLDVDGILDETLPFDIKNFPRFIDDLGVTDSGVGDAPIIDLGAHEHLVDCNANGVPDADDIKQESSEDCNLNNVPDECETSPDCNGNGTCDTDDIMAGTSHDCNENGIPDECEADCNGNGMHDTCDIAEGTSNDCNEDGIPDECLNSYLDCNDNGAVDSCETAAGATPDDNGNGVPDECEQEILFVAATAKGANTGLNWNDAFRDLQNALFVGRNSQGAVEEIWVAAGTYTPAGPSGDREASFVVPSGIGIYGGFAGGETDRQERDHTANITILSGDLNSDDVGDFTDVSRLDNSYNVVMSVDTDEATVLDGFTITAGHTTPLSPVDRDRGAGVWNSGDGLFRNITFLKNFTIGDGGGLYSAHNPILENCRFIENFADYRGGGMFNDARLHGEWPPNAAPYIVDCLFLHNIAFRGGGLLNKSGCEPIIAGCKFIGNTAISFGGGVFGDNNNDPLFVNCLFSGNSSSGGGASWDLNSINTFLNCTFTGNSCDNPVFPGGVRIGPGGDRTTTLVNCILWGNSSDGVIDELSQIQGWEGNFDDLVEVNYSCIQGLTGAMDGVGSIGDDPLLVDAAGPDGEVGTEDDNLRLSSGSPCIDTADNASVPEDVETDLDGNPRIIDGDDDGEAVVDMGAYEYLSCPSDFNGDGVVGPVDLATLLGSWGPCEGCPADLNGDDVVNAIDLSILLASWGECS